MIYNMPEHEKPIRLKRGTSRQLIDWQSKHEYVKYSKYKNTGLILSFSLACISCKHLYLTLIMLSKFDGMSVQCAYIKRKLLAPFWNRVQTIETDVFIHSHRHHRTIENNASKCARDYLPIFDGFSENVPSHTTKHNLE